MNKQKAIDYDSYYNPYVAAEINKEIENGFKVISVSTQPYYGYSQNTGEQEQFTVTTVIYEKIEIENRKIDTSKTKDGIQKIPYQK